MDGSDLALAIRRENPAQRIAMITEESSPTVRRSIQRKLGDIPVLWGEEVFDAMKVLRSAGQVSERERGEAQFLLASVDAAIAKKQNKIPKTAKLIKKKSYSSVAASL